MPIKIFQAQGHSGINDMEDDINAWLRQSDRHVLHLSTAMCSVGFADEGERYQQMSVTIIYREPNSN